MRIGVFYSAPYYVRGLDSALVALAARGHRIVLLGRGGERLPEPSPSLERTGRVEAGTFERRRALKLERALLILRTVRDVARFHDPALAGAHANRARAELRLARVLGSDDRRASAFASASLEPGERLALDAALEEFERLAPPDRGIVDAIRQQRLDLVLVISRVNIGGGQDEITKAARSAGVPSVLALYSWDNLTNKGLLHARPDRLLVWNAVQRREAIDLHAVVPETVAIVGAPRFDPFFALSPSADREVLRARLGLDPAARTVLYLGSSQFVAPREPEFVDQWIRSIREHPELAAVNVVARPHPGTLKEGAAWTAWHPPDDGRTVVALGDRRGGGQDLYDQLSACDAVVGLNTSAEIEAAIVGRPVLTVRAGELAPGQEGSTHYRYLLAEQGGPVEEAATLDEHLAQLVRSFEADEDAVARRRAFVESFVRPRGIDLPAGDAVADEVEAVGGSAPRRRWRVRRLR